MIDGGRPGNRIGGTRCFGSTGGSRIDGAVWVLRFKVPRESDHKRVERTGVIGRVEDFPTETQAFAEAERLRLYAIEPGSKRGTLTFAILAEFYLQELKKVPEWKKRRRVASSRASLPSLNFTCARANTTATSGRKKRMFPSTKTGTAVSVDCLEDVPVGLLYSRPPVQLSPKI